MIDRLLSKRIVAVLEALEGDNEKPDVGVAWDIVDSWEVAENDQPLLVIDATVTGQRSVAIANVHDVALSISFEVNAGEMTPAQVAIIWDWLTAFFNEAAGTFRQALSNDDLHVYQFADIETDRSNDDQAQVRTLSCTAITVHLSA